MEHNLGKPTEKNNGTIYWANEMDKSFPQLTTVLRIRPPVFAGEDQFLDGVLYNNELNGVARGADQVYTSAADQLTIFNSLVVPQLHAFIQGHDTSLVVCGPPFTGKSYTLFGPGLHCVDSEADYGILPRVASFLFCYFEPQEFVPQRNRPFKKITVSIFEIFTKGVRDLLNPTGTGPYQLHVNERGLVRVRGLVEEEVSSARDMISHLHTAMTTRVSSTGLPHHSTSLFVRLNITHFHPDGTRFTSQAQFSEMFSGEVNLPYPMQLDLLIFQALPRLFTLPLNCDLQLLNDLDLFVLLKDSFTGKMGHTLVLCCLAPSALMMNSMVCYLSVLLSALAVVKTHLSTMSVQQRNHQLLESKWSYESSEEERDWGKRVDGQDSATHGHLECIEEVTESEEEIASSDEKMSHSESGSGSGSDLDDPDAKCSESNFLDNLNSMCEQFNSFVDHFVDSFKSKPAVSLQPQNKQTCSAARRGGVPWMKDLPLEVKLLPTRNQPVVPHADSNKRGKADQEGSSTSRTSSDSEPKKKNELIVRLPTSEDSSDTTKRSSETSSETSDMSSSKDSTDVSKTEEDWSGEVQRRLQVEQEALGRLQRLWARQGGGDLRTWHKQDLLKLCSVLAENRKVLEEIVNNLDDVRQPTEMENIITQKIRELRSNRQKFTSLRTKLDLHIKEGVTVDEEAKRDYMMADLMVETFDMSMEHLNRQLLNSPGRPTILPPSQVGRMVGAALEELSVAELRNLVLQYFTKIVDLRESGRTQDECVKELMLQVDSANLRISHMHRKLQETRNYNHNQPMMVAYPTPSRTKAPLALPQGVPTIPQQNLSKLQSKPVPRTKVTMRQRKIIIEQNRDK